MLKFDQRTYYLDLCCNDDVVMIIITRRKKYFDYIAWKKWMLRVLYELYKVAVISSNDKNYYGLLCLEDIT